MRKHRREPTQPNLTPMMDVLTIITLFLISLAEFGPESLEMVPDLFLPFSRLTSDVETASQVTVNSQGVSAKFLTQTYPLNYFSPGQGLPINRTSFRTQMQSQLRNLLTTTKSDDIVLNVLADRALPYQVIYDVVRSLRESGFHRLAFVAQNQEVAK